MDGSDIDKLSEFLPEITPEQEEKFREFYDILCHFNKRINLVSRASLKSAAGKHFSDSYMGLKIFEKDLKPGSNVYDFGSGNGFPGVVSSGMYPDINHILIERDRRKAEFLRVLCGELKLTNVGIHGGPTGELKENSVEIGMSRAMAPMPKMLLELRSICKQGAQIYLFKGDHWATELGSCPPQIFDIWEIKVRGKYNIPSLDMERFIIECIRI